MLEKEAVRHELLHTALPRIERLKAVDKQVGSQMLRLAAQFELFVSS